MQIAGFLLTVAGVMMMVTAAGAARQAAVNRGVWSIVAALVAGAVAIMVSVIGVLVMAGWISG